MSCEPPRMTIAAYFDGSCPVCRREIGFYQTQAGADAIEWVDISAADHPVIAPDLTREAAKQRFHVRRADGGLATGAAAFVELWLQMPRFRWLGAVGRLPGARHVLELGYRGFLRARPAVQRIINRLRPNW